VTNPAACSSKQSLTPQGADGCCVPPFPVFALWDILTQLEVGEVHPGTDKVRACHLPAHAEAHVVAACDDFRGARTSLRTTGVTCLSMCCHHGLCGCGGSSAVTTTQLKTRSSTRVTVGALVKASHCVHATARSVT
jgi:hypothetical protein